MVNTIEKPSGHPLADYVHRLETGGILLDESSENLIEVVGILKSYGVVLDAYSNNLIYIANQQFLVLFPFLKYFNGEFSLGKLWQHWNHDRINYEYAEYCMKSMLWHGSGGLDAYLDTDDFKQNAEKAILAKLKFNPIMLALHRLFPGFLPEMVRQMSYYSGLGQFWRVMSDMFLDLSDRYDRGEIKTVLNTVEHIQAALVANAAKPITYAVEIGGQTYDILPASAELTFLMDTGVPYVEAIFFRGTPFPGTISYNAQVQQIPDQQGAFCYGALYADPLPIGGSGIPPTLLMQDMRHYLPDYLHQLYQNTLRGEDDLRVKICETFQKSMFCVTSAAIRGLMPHPIDSGDPEHLAANRKYLEGWMDRFLTSRIYNVNQ
ncbi:CO2 hydration protein [Thalassoporum mexicanum PCC 7367]|uniref:CO2 hydration protein n=1 Tax=Thalassoporum mexicanum TaxID=3457544 RepID=UPI00029FFB6B|nr:CO2 hydration protein [Pseudanabaena sp. PCC 7367]AFY69875.1 CO2 hydration protein [Pseudanabaena sp. PCC 7367]